MCFDGNTEYLILGDRNSEKLESKFEGLIFVSGYCLESKTKHTCARVIIPANTSFTKRLETALLNLDKLNLKIPITAGKIVEFLDKNRKPRRRNIKFTSP
jgi:hypothetical protein